MENIIECNNLTHYYGKRLIYENLSFSVPKGRILGLLGTFRRCTPQHAVISVCSSRDMCNISS